ncbi:hypothetical protein DD237_007844 [Peronospora effusa]|uniref:Uncharacterized protein n=1 Tax=Peronospora effusa TaxID=542832 RepID=A0A3R7W6D9_9STRA|nr:hypothetical protein DD237_007844 [Peronospora effusa]
MIVISSDRNFTWTEICILRDSIYFTNRSDWATSRQVEATYILTKTLSSILRWHLGLDEVQHLAQGGQLSPSRLRGTLKYPSLRGPYQRERSHFFIIKV